MSNHFPEHEVLELDKDEVHFCADELARTTNDSDLVFLHSGGNLGDRGRLSEIARRLVIQSLPTQRIVSLPQTIYFSDTEVGRQEREITRRIYNQHPHLLIAGRDLRSAEIAGELFPNAKTLALPDFVLSLNPQEWVTCQDSSTDAREATLCCLRMDDESALGDSGRQQVLDLVDGPTEHFDTTISSHIEVDGRVEKLHNTLRHFMRFRSVVTDRYHGLIFAVLCRLPTVALPTVDHKLTSAFEWFNEIPYVRFAESLDQVPTLLEEVRSVDLPSVHFDWNEKHFTPFAKQVTNWFEEHK